MADIVLVQPKTGSLDRINTRLPLGLLYASSYALEEGYKIAVVDQRLGGWEGQLRKEIKNARLFVGTTCMTGPQITHALEIATIAKQAEIPTVFGGVHPTVLPEQTLANPLVDIVVRGEGERPLLWIAKALEKGKDLGGIKGTSYKHRGKVRHNPDQGFLQGGQIRKPPYELIDMKRYSSVSFHGEKSYSMAGSRGCPYRCGFCYNSIEGMGSWRPFPLDSVIENAKELVEKYGAKTLYFEDDNICTDKSQFEALLKELKTLGVNVAFQGIRMDAIARFSEETFKIMESFPNLSMDMGIESINPRVLEMIDKSLSLATVRCVLKRLERKKFMCKFNFIVGLPTESMKEIRNDIDFALKLNMLHKTSYSIINIYTPYPGTKLFQLALDNGFVPPDSLDGWSEFSQMGWLRTANGWLTRRERDYLRDVSFLSLFASPNIGIKTSRKVNKLAIKAYSPIARARLRSGFFRPFPERALAEKLAGF